MMTEWYEKSIKALQLTGQSRYVGARSSVE
jgi:hypothetical protein